MKILTLAAALAAVSSSFSAVAAPGDLDVSFGSGGVAETSVMGLNGEAHAIIHDSSGRLVVAGFSYNEDTHTSVIVVARFLADGTLDTSFGDSGTGFVTTTPPGGLTIATNFSSSIAIDSKDRIVVGGETSVMDPRGFAVEIFSVARYLPSGLPDESFGGRGLVQTMVSPGEIYGIAASIAIDSKDRIVAAGSTSGGSTSGGVLIRYNEDGAQDHLFAHTGVVVTNPFGFFSSTAVRIDSAGRIVLLGNDIDPDSFETVSVVERYLADGELDASFGGLEPGLSESTDVEASALLIDSANNLLIAGAATADSTFAIERLDDTGLLDTFFGVDGIATAPVSLPSFLPSDLQWDSHGNIVVATTVNANLGAFRFSSDGSFDESFGDYGIATGPTSDTTSYFAAGLTIDDSDRLTVGGWSNDGTSESFVLARFDN